MKEQNNPCHGCPDRFVVANDTETYTCHSVCERFKKANAEHIEYNRKIRTIKERENMLRGYYCDTALRNQKARAHGKNKKGKVL